MQNTKYRATHFIFPFTPLLRRSSVGSPQPNSQEFLRSLHSRGRTVTRLKRESKYRSTQLPPSKAVAYIVWLGPRILHCFLPPLFGQLCTGARWFCVCGGFPPFTFHTFTVSCWWRSDILRRAPHSQLTISFIRIYACGNSLITCKHHFACVP